MDRAERGPTAAKEVAAIAEAVVAPAKVAMRARLPAEVVKQAFRALAARVARTRAERAAKQVSLERAVVQERWQALVPAEWRVAGSVEEPEWSAARGWAQSLVPEVQVQEVQVQEVQVLEVRVQEVQVQEVQVLEVQVLEVQVLEAAVLEAAVLVRAEMVARAAWPARGVVPRLAASASILSLG